MTDYQIMKGFSTAAENFEAGEIVDGKELARALDPDGAKLVRAYLGNGRIALPKVEPETRPRTLSDEALAALAAGPSSDAATPAAPPVPPTPPAVPGKAGKAADPVAGAPLPPVTSR